MLEQGDDIGATQQGLALALVDAFLGHEQHGDHHHRHVMVPAGPEPDLVIGEAAVGLGILEAAFDPEALSLHGGETVDRRLGGRVAEAELDAAGCGGLTAGDQVPTLCGRLFAIPEPDPSADDLDGERAPRAGAQIDPAPSGARLPRPSFGA